MIRSPNYRIVLLIEALDPKGYEMAFLELRADSEEQAEAIAGLYLRPEIRIISTGRISRD